MSIGGLAAGMAHEINNPLAGILQNSQVLKKRLFSDIEANKRAARECGIPLEKIREYLEERDADFMIDAVMSSGERASRIVNNMLSFSRKSESSFMPYSMPRLIDDTVELASNDYNLKKKYDFRKIRIVKVFHEDVPDTPCDRSKLQQVIFNILKNGAEAMSEIKSENYHPSFYIRVFTQNDRTIMEFEDNGPGISEKHKKNVFDPFFTTKDVGVGTGLGLSISYFIIRDNHGGDIHVESKNGHGAKFIISLPLVMPSLSLIDQV